MDVTRGLTDSEARILREVVQIVRGRQYDLGDRGRRVPRGGEDREGVLVTGLSAPACVTDPPTSAIVAVYTRDRETKQLEPTGDTITVYDCDPDLDGVAGAYCRFNWIGGMLQFTHVSCSDSLADCSGSGS